MAVRIGQLTASQILSAPDGVSTQLDSETLNCSTIGDHRHLIVVVFLSDNSENPVVIDSLVFDPGGLNLPLTLLDDANSDGKFLYYSLQNVPATDAIVRLMATSSGDTWNGILGCVLLYDAAQNPDTTDVLINDFFGDGVLHSATETSGEEDQLHLIFLGVDTTSAGSTVDKYANLDGSNTFLFNWIDPFEASGTRVLSLIVSAINGDRYADRTISKFWAVERTKFWAFDARIAEFKQLHVDIPGAIAVPQHIVDF